MNNNEVFTVAPVENRSLIRPMTLDRPASADRLKMMIGILRRRRIWVIASIILGGVVAFIVCLTMRPVYESTSTIELNKSGSGSLGLDFADAEGPTGSFGGEGLETDLKTESAVLKSDSLALSVIKQLNLSAQPLFIDPRHAPLSLDELDRNYGERTRLVSIFESHFRVSSIPGTRLIQVTFLSNDPRQAAEVANGLIEKYKEQYLQSHYAAVSQASEWLTKQLSDLKANVERSETKLADFEKASGILTVPGESMNGNGEVGGQIHNVVVQKLDILNAELTTAEANRVQKEAIYRLAETGNADVILGLRTSGLDQNSSTVAGGEEVANLAQLESKMSDLKLNLAQGTSVYGPNNRHLKEIQAQVDVVNGQIRDSMQRIVQSAAADLKIAQQTEDALRARFNEQQDAATKLNEKNIQLAILSQEAASNKKLYEDLYTKLQEADVSAGIKATNITIVDPATPASAPVRPRKRLYMELGLMFGALFGLGGAYLAENFDNTVATTSEIEEITGGAVIGVIPRFQPASRGRLGRSPKQASRGELQTSGSDESPVWILAHPNSVASEALRSLRTAIYLSRPGGAPKAILVTSSVPGEGKTTLTSNLAIAIAQHGQKAVIVEADLRRPTVKSMLNVPSDLGLSNVLAGTTSLDQAIRRRVDTANLDVLPAGPKPPLPSELLGSPMFEAVLNDLRARYDIVLIDSPPALILADAISIAAKADAVLWMVRAGMATRPFLARAGNLIRRSQMPFIGFVLNGVDDRYDPYYYGAYGYKQYDGYYGGDDAGNK